MSGGFFPLQRQIMDHWTYKDIYAYRLWSHMLLVARYSPEPYTDTYNGHLVTLNYGEFVFGRNKWVDELGIPEQRMKTLVKKFVDQNMIRLQYTYPKGTVYAILNYSKFNQQSNQQSNQQETLEPQGFEGYTIQQNNQLSIQQPSSNHPQKNKVIKREEKTIVAKEDCDQSFEIIWKMFKPALKGSKKKALDKWRTLWKNKKIDIDNVVAGTTAYIQYVDHKRKSGFPDLSFKNAETYFNQEHWNDDHTITVGARKKTPNTPAARPVDEQMDDSLQEVMKRAEAAQHR